MLKTQNKKRITYIDVARGIALLLVIVTHAGIGWWVNDGYAQWITNFIMIGNLPIFFFLSGFLFHDYSWKKRIINTLNNLIVPYVFGSLMIVALAWLLNWPVKSTLAGAIYGNGGHDLTLLGDLAPIGAIWFFLAMAISVLTFSLLVKLVNFTRLPEFSRRIIVLLASLLIFFIIVRHEFVPYLWPFDIQSGLLGSTFLALGYLFKYLFDERTRQFHFIQTPYFALFCLAIWVYISKTNIFYFVSAVINGNAWQTLLAAFASIIVIFDLAIWLDKKIHSWMAWIGRNSGMLMVTHDWVLIFLQVQLVNRYLYILHLNNYLGWILAALIIGFLTFVTAFLINRSHFVQTIFFQRNWPLKVQ
ncbi:acyltransferase family protein [Oenococcus sp.]|uniref:acyltransferase family protein n=1 Tax=Oenococcus sp. TaxID=1979414 RepID=UPI0039E811BB